MRNILLKIEYDGSRYQGWSRLGKGESTNTISNRIIEVLQKMTGETIDLNCGMRTEVGVHAYGQVANFKTNSKYSVQEIQRYLNRYLPMDIAITECKEVPERFHAQLNAKEKIYVYRIITASVPSVFDRRYTFHCFRKPNKEIMDEAASVLVGEHDFKNFSTVKSNKSTVRKISEIEIYEDAKEMQITITANDFLHNMQRLIVSTLIDIGIGARPKEDTKKILEGTSVPSAPCDPKGMYLQDVIYE